MTRLRLIDLIVLCGMEATLSLMNFGMLSASHFMGILWGVSAGLSLFGITSYFRYARDPEDPEE